jgi:hypothetical protein
MLHKFRCYEIVPITVVKLTFSITKARIGLLAISYVILLDRLVSGM